MIAESGSNFKCSSVPTDSNKSFYYPIVANDTGRSNLRLLAQIFANGESIWVKTGNTDFYLCALQDGHLAGVKTKKLNKDDPQSRVTMRNQQVTLSSLIDWSKTNEGGLFFLPGKPQEFPTKGASRGSNALFGESDYGSRDEQLQRLEWLEKVTGVDLSVIFSGGKSYHFYLVCEETISTSQWEYLSQVLTIVMLSDPKVAQLQQPMRLETGYRQEKGTWQYLHKLGTKAPLKTIVDGLQRAATELGFNIDQSNLAKKWGDVKKVLIDEFISNADKPNLIKAILDRIEAEPMPRSVSIAPSDYSSSYIPDIAQFLTKDNQNNLNQGVSSHRNNTATALLLDLLSIEQWLTHNRIQYTGNALNAFYYFCEQCRSGGGWGKREWDAIWNSNSKKSPTIAGGEDRLRTQLHYLRLKHDNEYKKITKKISQKLSQEEKKLAKEEKKAQTLPLINSYLEAQSLAQFSPTIINSRYFPSDYQFPPEANLIAIKGMQGTGKTQSLTSMVSKAQGEGQRIIILTHRIQLAISICDRFGIYHIDEITQKEDWQIAQVGLCIDSLHEKSRAKISAATFCNALVIIDECDQSFTHLFHSETLSKSANRVGVMTMFEEGIQNCFASEEGKVILLSADLSPKEINFIKGLARSPEDVKLFCLENVYQPIAQANRKIYTCEKQEELITILLNKLEKGEKALVHLGSQKEKYAYSTSTLQAYIKKRFPHLKILRIDAETLTDRFNPAYKCIGNINNILTNYDLVLASPSIETGVSIDIKEHFDSVFVLANGTQSVDSVCQSLERLREDVPRYIFIKEVSCQKIGNGGTSEDDFKKYTDNKQTKSLEDSMLASCYSSVGFHYKESWVKYAIDQNFGYKNYKQLILAKLSAKGYEIIPYACPILEENLKETKSQTKGTSKELYQKRIERIASLPNPEDEEYKALRDKSSRTKEEAESFLVGQIHRAYLVPEEESITSQLVKEHENGLYSKLELRYFLSEGKEFLEAKEKEKIAGAVYNKKYFKPDLIASSKAGAVETLGKHLPYLLDTNKIHRQSTLKDWANAVISDRDALKNHLGLNITPEANYPNIKVAQLLLDKVGLVLTQVGEEKISEATGTDGKVKRKTIRLYQLLPETIEKDKYVLDRWFKKDKAKAEAREVEEITKPLGQRLEESPKASPSVTTSSIATSNDIDTVPVKPNIYNSLNISTGTKTQDELLRDLNTSNVGSILPHLLKDKNTKDLTWLGEKVAQLNPTEKLASLYRAIAETLQGKTLGILDKYGLTIIQLKDLGAVKLSDSQTFKISELVA